jgi:uroporphyrinogen decarboxylase
MTETDALLSSLSDPWEGDASEARQAREALQDKGILTTTMPVPLAWWLYVRRNLEEALLDFYDYQNLVERALDAYSEWALEYFQATCELVQPDFVLFAGSVASMSVVSPDLYRRYAFPFLCEAVESANAYGVFVGVHMCGRCQAALPMLAEAGIHLIEPLESPPGGDVDLAEVKEEYGRQVCLKGNVNTFETLARGTPDEVKTEAYTCIQKAGSDGGFILSTGDQVPAETPEENMLALIETAQLHGRYESS